jgi:hypothetical protein
VDHPYPAFANDAAQKEVRQAESDTQPSRQRPLRHLRASL